MSATLWFISGYALGSLATILLLMFFCKPACTRDEHEDGGI